MIHAFEWFGTWAQIIGVYAMASKLVPPPLCYAVMTVGSVTWLILAGQQHNAPLFTLNAAFCVANLLGVWRWSRG